jgi:hypothetical protein
LGLDQEESDRKGEDLLFLLLFFFLPPLVLPPIPRRGTLLVVGKDMLGHGRE